MFIARIVVNRLNGNQQDLFLPITEFVSLIGEAEKQRQKEQEREIKSSHWFTSQMLMTRARVDQLGSSSSVRIPHMGGGSRSLQVLSVLINKN